MNIEANCEKCNKSVLLTSSYNGQPIICLDCGQHEEQKIKEELGLD